MAFLAFTEHCFSPRNLGLFIVASVLFLGGCRQESSPVLRKLPTHSPHKTRCIHNLEPGPIEINAAIEKQIAKALDEKVLESIRKVRLFRESSQHEADHGQLNHGPRAADGVFEIFGESSAAHDPGKRALDNPAFGQHHEGVLFLSARHDGQFRSGEDFGQKTRHLAAVALVGEDRLELGEPLARAVKQEDRGLAVAPIRAGDADIEQQAQRIDEDVAFAPAHFFARVVAAQEPPFSVVLDDWLSMMAAVGWGSFPALRRTLSRSASWMASSVPSFRHVLK